MLRNRKEWRVFIKSNQEIQKREMNISSTLPGNKETDDDNDNIKEH